LLDGVHLTLFPPTGFDACARQSKNDRHLVAVSLPIRDGAKAMLFGWGQEHLFNHQSRATLPIIREA
jgi:hypothetical protein